VARDAPLGEQNLGNLLRDPRQLIDELIFERRSAEHPELRPAHAPVFAHMRDEGSRITDIARRAHLTKATVVYLVNDLERLGYVERVPDAGDGRAKLVRPTERGHAAVAAARAAMADIEAEWAELLGARKLAQLRSLLEELHGKLWP
jgi:DNA-binding MarR family transcriptional regulator